jgi:hypothetical protein
MLRKTALMIAGCAFALTSGLALAAGAAADPLLGTWVMNVAKSKFTGTPPVKSYTLEYTDAGGGKTRAVADLVYGDGTKDHVEHTAAADGKPWPVTGYENADSIVVKKTGERSMHFSFIKGGKQIEWGKFTISKDGKTLHGMEGGTEAGGAKYQWTEVFDKR